MDSNGPVIVAIDDYKDNLVAVRAFVTDAFPGARVYTAENGSDGIELVRETNPDVILLDIVMPGMDGFEVCRILKEDPILQHIPVIFLTALKDDRESRIHALDVGGEAFILKPFEEAEFRAQIRAMVKIKAANVRELKEKKNLAGLVAERTVQLERELSERRRAEQELIQANQVLTQNRAAMLNLLADLKDEVEARKLSEEKFRLISENSPDHILIQDKDLRYIWVHNPQLGLNQEDMIGKTDDEFLSQEDARKLTSVKRKILETGEKIRVETSLTSKKGDLEDFEGIYLPIYNKEGERNGLMGYFRNVTRRKGVERALQESEERYRKLIENVPDYILVHRNGVILFVNPAATTSFGYTQEDLIGSHIMRYLTTESQEVVKDMMKKRSNGEKFPPYEITILTKDGRRKIIEVHGVPIQYSDGPASLNILTDVTEQRQLEDAQKFLLRSDYLQSGEDFFRSLARYLADALHMDYVCIDRLEGDLLTAHHVGGYFDGEFETNVSYTLKDTPCGDVVGKHICIFSAGVRHRFPKDIILQDMGAESYVGTTLWGFDGSPIGLIALIGRKPLDNPTFAESLLKQAAVRAAGELERSLAEQKLQDTNELFSLFMRHSPIYTYIKTVTPIESRVMIASDNFEQMIGIPGRDMVGKTMEELFSAEFAAKITADDWDIISNGKVLTLEETLHDRSYITIKFPIVQKGRSLVAGYTIDITDRKQAEAALHEANHKLRLLSSLTHHDIINQVSAVQLLLGMGLQTSDITKIHEYLSQAQIAGNQIEATIGFTREYQDFGTSSSGWQRIFPIIESAKPEISYDAIHIINEIPDDLEIYADPIIRKVFTNLMENAIRHGDKITYVRFLTDERNESVIIICEDDGVGVSSDEKDLIFEHGYGKNTGIGLFLAREILSITGLSIMECGEPGKGARFEILVPQGKYRF